MRTKRQSAYSIISLIIVFGIILSNFSVFAAPPLVKKNITVESTHDFIWSDGKGQDCLVDSVYGTDASLADGIHWAYVQTNADGNNNFVELTFDMKAATDIYKVVLGNRVEGWSEQLAELKYQYSTNKTDWTQLKAFANDELKYAGTSPDIKRLSWEATDNTPINARYIKMSFYIASTVTEAKVKYSSIDEVDIHTSPVDPNPNPDPDPNPGVPDDGTSKNLAAGKSYTPAWIADKWVDSGNQLTDEILSASLEFKDERWVGYYNNENDKFDIVMDIKESVEFEQIKANFLRNETGGISGPFNMKIEISDDNATWTTLVDHAITQIEDAVGIQRYIYTVPTEKQPAKARYIKFSINFRVWLFIDEIKVFDKKTPDETTDVDPDTLPTKNLVQNLDLECNRELLYNAPKNILTDGVHSQIASWNDSTWLSFNGAAGNPNEAVDNNKISIQYDLGFKKSVSKISLNALNDFAGGNAIGAPKGLKILVSDNGERWIALKNFKRQTPTDPSTFKYEWDGLTDEYITTLDNANMIYTQFIKIEVDMDTWVSFDEIEVLGKEGKCSTAGTLIGTPDAAKNLAAGKTYTIDYKAPRAYEDKDGVELTDSQFGSTNLYDLAWQGHTGEWPTRSVIIDLEKKHSISSVKANFLASTGQGVNLPTAVRLYVSDNGSNWSNLYIRNNIKTNTNGIFSLGWDSENLDGFEATNAAFVNARYVRVDMELDGWCFIDEIEAYGKDDVVPEGIELPKDANFDGALMASGDHTDNIKDMILVYNGPYRDYAGNTGYGDWSVSDFKPYVGYINKNGTAIDTMYDAFLFLAMGAESNNLFIESSDYSANPSNKADWEWFLNKTFDKNKDMYNLNESVKIVAKETNNPDIKLKVTVMVPFPDALSTNFGVINGKNLNLTDVEDCKIAIDWYMNEVLTRFSDANYEHLEFSGFYWMHETNYRSDLIKYTSDKTHQAKHQFFWIPYYNASGWNRWAEMGVDAVVLQPNHFFPESTPPSLDRVSDASTLAKMYGMGIEIEMDERAFSDVNRYNKYLDYLNGSVEFGYLNNCYRNWYNGIKGLMEAAYSNNPLAQSDNPTVRALYDYT